MPAYYPALQEFALQEDLAQAATRRSCEAACEAQVVVAAQAKPSGALAAADIGQAGRRSRQRSDNEVASEQMQAHAPPRSLDAAVAAAELAAKQLATARAAQASLAARIAAEKAKYGLTPGADAAQLALAAGKAERELALCQAQEQQVVAAQELAARKAALKPDDAATANAVTAAEKKVADAATALAAAHAALAAPSANYQPLGEQLPQQSTGRRLAFARWLTDRKNPLAARVAVNHIWLRHFGAPLVDNMFDFGLRSPHAAQSAAARLARRRADGARLADEAHPPADRHVERLSHDVRRRAARARRTSTIDPDNHFLWRMNTRRLEAEARARRRVLHGRQPRPHARRARPRLQAGVRQRRAAASTSGTPTRSRAKFLELFDGAERERVLPPQRERRAAAGAGAGQQRRRRSTSRGCSPASLASCVGKDAEPDHAFVQLAFEQILGREPSTAEVGRMPSSSSPSQAELLREPAKLTPFAGGAKADRARRPPIPIQRARENLTHVLFNHNDFVTIR